MGGTRLRGRVAAGLLVAASALALVLSTAPAPAAASVTTLTLIAGSASVTRGGAMAAAIDGEIVRPGDEIRTSAGGHAVLTFVDGSTVTLEPGASLVLEEATSRQGSSVIRVFQAIGLTWSSVARLVTPASRFEVRTPAATASARGTAFEVEVSSDGATRVRTSEGEVAVSNALGEVLVPEGEETRATPDAPPARPSAPPSSTRRILEIGDREIVIVDAAGRGCGRHDGKIVEQIPGCVVRDGSIEIRDAERVGAYRLAVTEDVGADTSVVERTVAAGASTESVRVLDLPTAELGVSPIHVAPATSSPIQVTLPLIGTVPVRLDLATGSPGTPAVAPSSPLTAAPNVVPQASLPTIPFPASPTAVVAPSITALPSVEASILPTPTIAAPTIAAPTIAAPTVALSTPTPTPAPTAEPTPTPTPTPTASPTPTPSPTPAPTATPAPTPAPPGGVTAVAALGVVTVEWSPSTTVGATYRVERSTGGATVSLGSTALLAITDTPGSGTHTYRVIAVANGLESAPASATVTVP